jgi:hypothetical protein
MSSTSIFLRFITALIVVGAAVGMLSAQPNISSGKIERVEKFGSKYVEPRTVDVWLVLKNAN